MLDINKHAAAIEAIRTELSEMVDKYRKGAAAKEAAASNGKQTDQTLSLKAMAAMPADDGLAAVFSDFENRLSDMADEPDSWALKGQEHIYANLAQVFRTYAEHFEAIAKTWAPAFKSKVQAVQFTDKDRMTDEELATLAKNCTDNFRGLIGMVNQIKDRQNDKSAQSLIEEITGQPTIIRERNGNAEFMLDIPRFRNRQATTASPANKVEAKQHAVLYVDDERAPGSDLGDQTRQFCGKDSVDFLKSLDQAAKRLTRDATAKWHYDTEYEFWHDGSQYTVEMRNDTE